MVKQWHKHNLKEAMYLKKYGSVVNKMPDVIELTYVNKNYFNLLPELNSISLPISNL